MSQPDNVHVVRRNWRGKPVEFSAEARQAMDLIEGLINSGDLALVPDQYMGNRLMFRPTCRAPTVETITATLGEVVGLSLDPLEQAIESTARILLDEQERMSGLNFTLSGRIPSSILHTRLGAHLEQLLAEQLKRVQAHE